MHKRIMNRRWTAAVFGVALVSLVWTTIATGAEFNWARFKGKNITVRMIAQKHPWASLVTGWADEFERLTGIRAVIESIPQEQFNQKIGVEVASGTGQVDVISTIPSQEGAKFYLAGYYASLEPYLKDSTLTGPDYDLSDFPKPVIDGMKYKGTMIAVPWGTEVGILYYRKDLFEKHNLKVPGTLAELEEAAKKLTLKGPDGKVEVYGITNRGRREALGGGTLSAWLHNFGGDWLDKNGDPAINSREAVRGWDAYSRIVRLYGPPGIAGFQWYEAASMMAQGRAAMWVDSGGLGAMFLDPEKTKIVGKIGYAKFPAGPVRDQPNLLIWGLALSTHSKNKEAAWLLMQWLTNKTQQLRAQVAGGSTARISAWNSPEYKSADKNPEWTQICLSSMKIANPEWLPPIVAAIEAKEIVGGVVQAGILGEDVKGAADKAAVEMKRLMETTEKRK